MSTPVVHQDNVERLPKLYETWRGLIEHYKLAPAFYLGTPHPPPVCLELWRGDLNVHTNGNVTPCCFDPDEEIVIGNVLAADFNQIVRGPRMTRLLRDTLAGRPPERCLRCRRFEGYRAGLKVEWLSRESAPPAHR